MKRSVVLGLLAPSCPSLLRREWNAVLRERGLDAASFEFYRVTSDSELLLRLSEMFLLDRRGYIIHTSYAESIVQLLDTLDPTAQKAGRVDTVINRSGVLVGAYVGESTHRDSFDERMLLWGIPT